jgi:DNA-binding transcriptional ArsR family regulator
MIAGVDVFEVLAEPNRRAILTLLRESDRAVGDLVETLALAQPTVSKHLKVLRTNGFVSVSPDAQRRVYHLRPEPLRALDAWLEPYRTTWANRLDALTAHLDRMEER